MGAVIEKAVGTPTRMEAQLERLRKMRAALGPDDDTSVLDAEIARLEQALEAMWRR